MKTVMLRLRVEPEFKELIQDAVKKGKAESMSELVRKATLRFLSTEEGEAQR
jgi:Arc/MetJ-type ribon-helix-helix transcriptional regulator